MITGSTFGLVLLALVYTIGPISGCHMNPAVTMGFVVSRRMSLADASAIGSRSSRAASSARSSSWGIFQGSPIYSRQTTGLGANGWGEVSMIGINAGGAFAAEVVLTFLFVLVVLSATSYVASANFAGLAIGMALTTVHLFGIPLTGTSVNPARSLGPAVIVGGTRSEQVWLFIVAPLVGGIVAAVAHRYVLQERAEEAASVAGGVQPSDVIVS